MSRDKTAAGGWCRGRGSTDGVKRVWKRCAPPPPPPSCLILALVQPVCCRLQAAAPSSCCAPKSHVLQDSDTGHHQGRRPGKSASASEKLSVGIGKEWRGRIRARCPERQLVQDKKFGEGGAREVSTAGSFDTGEEFRSCGC